MDFTTCLQSQLQLHPSMQAQDVLKLCYQAARGAEHLLTDAARARTWFDREYAGLPADAALPLLEPISPHIVRVNLAAWKATGLPAQWLFRMFAHTSGIPHPGTDLLEEYIGAASSVASKTIPGWADALSAWRQQGMPALHHSEAYRAAERPAYRIVDRRFACVLPILRRVAATEGIRVIAIDGRAASGKTTRARLLGAVLEAPVIHMDDFFLPPTLRTEARFAQPGGNIHHERFAAEVLPPLAADEGFSYRVFDCGRMDFAGTRAIPAAPIRIVEGSYAHHPALGDYAQLRVFTDIDPEEQRQRIRLRNGEQMAALFQDRWIPLEETYFAHFCIPGKADLRV